MDLIADTQEMEVQVRDGRQKARDLEKAGRHQDAKKLLERVELLESDIASANALKEQGAATRHGFQVFLRGRRTFVTSGPLSEEDINRK